jgi:hypothetical protein
MWDAILIISNFLLAAEPTQVEDGKMYIDLKRRVLVN